VGGFGVTLPHQRHGGNVDAVAARWGMPPRLVDFSVNTHPFGPPREALAAARRAVAAAHRYPDPDSAPLARALAAAHGLPEGCVVAGNGATELIDLVPRALNVRRAVVVAPTYGEYAASLVRAGAQLHTVRRTDPARFPAAEACEAIGRTGADLVVVGSPNNPTGERLDDGAFVGLLGACEAAGARLLIDEAFVEYDPAGSRVDQVAESTAVIVLRGFTKFYALAGLRVGYLVATPEVAAAVRAARPPWSVNRVAEAAALACLGLPGYEARERDRVIRLRSRFARALAALGLEVLASDANFLLCRLPRGAGADRLYEGLARDGYLVRHCASFGLGDGYLRLRVHRPLFARPFLAALARRLGPKAREAGA
jgi:threonine-phosphate decarboxylase